jgi:hypothetical protein
VLEAESAELARGSLTPHHVSLLYGPLEVSAERGDL